MLFGNGEETLKGSEESVSSQVKWLFNTCTQKNQMVRKDIFTENMECLTHKGVY